MASLPSSPRMLICYYVDCCCLLNMISESEGVAEYLMQYLKQIMKDKNDSVLMRASWEDPSNSRR